MTLYEQTSGLGRRDPARPAPAHCFRIKQNISRATATTADFDALWTKAMCNSQPFRSRPPVTCSSLRGTLDVSISCLCINKSTSERSERCGMWTTAELQIHFHLKSIITGLPDDNMHLNIFISFIIIKIPRKFIVKPQVHFLLLTYVLIWLNQPHFYYYVNADPVQ